ncbi:MAG: type III-B CRISPR module-associated protein Cmr5 [Candidatus Eisenbacteria bacterium]
MPNQTRSQKLAGTALDHINSVGDRTWKKDYGRLWLRFPGLVLTNGLMQTVAFYASRDNDANTAFLDHLGKLVLPEEGTGSVYDYLRGADYPAYMQATRIALAAAVYYARFSEAILGIKKTDEGDGA